jgi:hypothetical protein
MKIIMILGTGILLTFPTVKEVKPDCFSQGYDILKKISTYQDTGNRDQGWYLNGTKIHVTGFYCQ